MLNKKNPSIQIIIWLIISIFLLSYVGYRAYSLSFTHDESLSYTIIKGDQIWKDTANNHQLNTDLMKVMSNISGDSELSLRFPNVLLFIVFLFFSFNLLKHSDNIWIMISGLILMVINPFVLDYFSLARGYGLSIGFMTASLYFLLKGNIKIDRFGSFIKDLVFSMIFAGLAVRSNLSLINFYIALLIIFIGRFIYMRQKGAGLKRNEYLIFACIIVLCVIPVYFSIERLLWLNSLNQLFFGTDNFDDTFNSVIISSLYNRENSPVVGYIKFTLLGLFISGFVYAIIKKKFFSRFFTMILTISIIILGLYTEFFFFGGKFPKERTAIFFIPLFTIFFYYFSEDIIMSLKGRKKTVIAVIFFIIIGTSVIFNFSKSANLTYAYTWDYDANTKAVMKLLEIKTANPLNKDRKFTISNNWLFEPSLNYYIKSRNLNFEKTNRNGISQSTDFVYDFTADFNLQGFGILAIYPETKTSLYQNSAGFQ